MNMKKLLLPVVALFTLSSCASVNNAITEKSKTIEYYRIFDVKTSAKRFVVAEAASDGLGANTTDINENMPIPTGSAPPSSPGRFKLDSPFKGTQLGALMAGGGNTSYKIATCDEAVWTANAKKNVPGSSNLSLTACLFEYTDGYHLDMFATFQKKEGGLMQLSRNMTSAMVGTPEEWTEKTFLDIARAIQKKTGAQISFLEGYPPVKGTPWLDGGESFSK